MNYHSDIIDVVCFVLVLLFTWIRLHCRRHGNFSIIKSDTRFSGTVEKSLEGVTRSECVLSCLTCDSCFYVNYHPTNLACELMNAQGNEIDEAGWQYLSTNYGTRNRGPICRSFSPCERTEACVDTCFEDDQVGYKCIPNQFKQLRAISASGFPINGHYPANNLIHFNANAQTFEHTDSNFILDFGSITFIRFISMKMDSATPHLQISIGNFNSRNGNVFCSRVSQVAIPLVVECSSYLSGRYIVLYHAAGDEQLLSVRVITAFIDDK